MVHRYRQISNIHRYPYRCHSHFDSFPKWLRKFGTILDVVCIYESMTRCQQKLQAVLKAIHVIIDLRSKCFLQKIAIPLKQSNANEKQEQRTKNKNENKNKNKNNNNNNNNTNSNSNNNNHHHNDNDNNNANNTNSNSNNNNNNNHHHNDNDNNNANANATDHNDNDNDNDNNNNNNNNNNEPNDRALILCRSIEECNGMWWVRCSKQSKTVRVNVRKIWHDHTWSIFRIKFRLHTLTLQTSNNNLFLIYGLLILNPLGHPHLSTRKKRHTTTAARLHVRPALRLNLKWNHFAVPWSWWAPTRAPYSTLSS